MKINHDCLRDVLLCLEEHLTNTPTTEIKQMTPTQIKEYVGYSEDEIINILYILRDEGYIEAKFLYADDIVYHCSVSRVTSSGREKAKCIRPKTAWEQMCSVFKNAGGMTIQLFKTTVPLVSKELIMGHLRK